VAAAGRDFLSRRQRRLLPPFIFALQHAAGLGSAVPGRPVIGESFSHGALSNRLEVWMDDAPLLIERLHLADGRLASVAQYPWVGTLLFYPASEALLDGVRERLTTLEIMLAPR
jgi:urease accessory protein UreH